MAAAAVDTNLLLLLVVGHIAPSYIEKHKRPSAFRPSDYVLLVNTLSKFSRVRLIPHALAEASNLLGHGVLDPLRTQLFSTLKEVIDRSSEDAVESRTAAARPQYTRLGLTDAAWLTILDARTTLLSDDRLLCVSAADQGFATIFFSDLRVNQDGRNAANAKMRPRRSARRRAP